MRKEDKAVVVRQIATTLREYAYFYLTDTATLNAARTSSLRMECYKRNVKFVVVKNTLFKEALKQIKGEDFSALDSALKGNTAVMFSNNANSPAKLIKVFAKEIGVPKLKAAYVYEGFYIGAENLDLLVSIKSKNELTGDVVALLQSPAKNIISALQFGRDTIYGILEAFSKR